MPRMNGMFRIFIALLLVFSLTGFLCEDTSDDDASCTGAATNIADILWAEYGDDPASICDDLNLMFGMDAAAYADCIATVTTEDYDGLKTGLATACSEDNWAQADINCAVEADTLADLFACAP